MDFPNVGNWVHCKNLSAKDMIWFVDAHQKLVYTFIRHSFMPRLSSPTRTFRKQINTIKLVPKCLEGVIIFGDIEITLLKIRCFPLDFEDGSIVALVILESRSHCIMQNSSLRKRRKNTE